MQKIEDPARKPMQNQNTNKKQQEILCSPTAKNDRRRLYRRLAQVDDLSLFHQLLVASGLRRRRRAAVVGAPNVSRQVVVEGERGSALRTAEGFLIGVKLALVPLQALLVAEIPGFQLRNVHFFAQGCGSGSALI
jgi:hypothetical protein